tara:strand:+ start:261 stop:1802 length:1542 start_codon:yes stop_codon:yes gene_type:complete
LKTNLYINFIYLIILGAITSLSLHPFNYFIINFFSFTLFFIFLYKKLNSYKNSLFFVYGWLFGFGYFATNLYWISISLTFDQNFKSLIPITIILIPSFLALFYGLITYIFAFLGKKKVVSSFLIFSLLFGIMEFIRGSILTGFPWNLIAYSFSNQLELLSIISVIGTYGFNLFCITLFTCPAILILESKKNSVIICSFFIFLTILFIIFGTFYKNKFNEAKKENYNYYLRVLGSNISIDRFYSNVNSVLVIEELIKISNPNKNEKTIFIWPEGILPEISQKELKEYSWLFSEKFSEKHLIIIGINSEQIKNGTKKYFNSLSIYDNQLNLLNYYNKINLVPFGEFLPFEKILSTFGLRSLTNNYQSFSAGNKRSVIEVNQKNFLLKILPLICYEIIYSGKLFDDYEFDLIVNISEDGWFGKSIGPKQHFVHSIFRAIESGKYILRSANNGIAGVINPIGIVEKKVDFGNTGYIDFKEARKIQPTIFSKYGNKIFGILILLYIFLIFSFNRIKNE